MPAQDSPRGPVSLIEFPSEGVTLRGRLYLPAAAQPPHVLPGEKHTPDGNRISFA
jgi:hypothetical protein